MASNPGCGLPYLMRQTAWTVRHRLDCLSILGLRVTVAIVESEPENRLNLVLTPKVR
jgi:hypothetical protein